MNAYGRGESLQSVVVLCRHREQRVGCESLPYVRVQSPFFFLLLFFPTSSKKVMLNLLRDLKQNTTRVGFT